MSRASWSVPLAGSHALELWCVTIHPFVVSEHSGAGEANHSPWCDICLRWLGTQAQNLPTSSWRQLHGHRWSIPCHFPSRGARSKKRGRTHSSGWQCKQTLKEIHCTKSRIQNKHPSLLWEDWCSCWVQQSQENLCTYSGPSLDGSQSSFRSAAAQQTRKEASVSAVHVCVLVSQHNKHRLGRPVLELRKKRGCSCLWNSFVTEMAPA